MVDVALAELLAELGSLVLLETVAVFTAKPEPASLKVAALTLMVITATEPGVKLPSEQVTVVDERKQDPWDAKEEV